MLISLLIVAILSAGGGALTYLFAREKGLLWRLAAGNVIGSVTFFFPAIFLAGPLCLFGAAPWIVIASLVITASPLLLLRSKKIKAEFRHEKDLAKGKVQGATFSKIVRFTYYALFLLLFLVFFDKAMIVAADGIFTGGSQNLGDLPYHLGAIFGFSDGCNFPPQNPSFAGATFTYPFTADFLTSTLVAVGAAVEDAMWVQNAAWAFSLLVILERFVRDLTGSKLAGRIAPALLFFTGGLGFLWFLQDYWNGARGIWDLLWQIPGDYTIGDDFRWGNSLVTLFITQRSLLLGMPLTLIVLGSLWKTANGPEPGHAEVLKIGGYKLHPLLPSFLVGLLAGTLPLVHAHSLFVLFVVSACWFFVDLGKWKEWIAFGTGTALIAVPELIWIMTGSASRSGEFIGWHFGFDAGDENIFLFWLKNTGLFIPILIGALTFIAVKLKGHGETGDVSDAGDIHESLDAAHDTAGGKPLPSSKAFYSRSAFFFLPFLLLFAVSNLMRLAPWEWDNIKVLIYWFLGSIPFVAAAVAWIWEKGKVWKAVSALVLLALVFSGALDVWRTASGQIRNQVFDPGAVAIASWARYYTEPNAIFLNAPTYNTAIVLTGRLSVIRYPGHLSSHGIDYGPREEDVKKIYRGAPDAEELLRKYKIDYILVSPAERSMLQVSERYLGRFEVAHEEGAYRLYKVAFGR